MPQQQLSKTIKKGEPLDHLLAVSKVFWFLDKNKKNKDWIVDVGVGLRYSDEFAKQLPKSMNYKGHAFDLVIMERVFDPDGEVVINLKFKAVIEIGGNIGFYYLDPVTGKPTKANPTRHSKPLQKRNDKIVQNFLKSEPRLKHCKYITLLKEEILGDCGKNGKDDSYKTNTIRYLEENLRDWIV